MSNITYEGVSDALLESVPELQVAYQQELSSWNGVNPPGAYVIFGFVVAPKLRELLAREVPIFLLERIFKFFEDMASSSDIQVSNLLQIAVFEWLVGDPAGMAVAWKYMGPKSRANARHIAGILDCEENLPDTK